MTAPRRRKPLQGDEDALFEALARELVRIVQQLVNTDPATVDDACQFAWLQLLRCQPNRETVRPWLITVARNEAIRLDRIRRRLEALSIGEREPGCHPEPAVPTDAYALAIDLDEALSVLASLPERKRNLYALKVLVWEGCHHGKRAQLERLPLGNRLHRGEGVVASASAVCHGKLRVHFASKLA